MVPPVVFGLAASLFTYLGGRFALRYHDRLHVILGFSAGAVIGVGFFDLLPEALELAGGRYDVDTVTSVVALGFTVFMLLSQWFLSHGHDEEEECENHNHKGTLGASSIVAHSFLDGLAIGLAFQASEAVGLVVALAVLAHNFSDGINTVGLVLHGKADDRKGAMRWLLMNAAAPLVGVAAGSIVSVPETSLGLLLALFCGFFLYIGASHLLPESHHRHPKAATTLATLLGIGVLYLAVRLAHG